MIGSRAWWIKQGIIVGTVLIVGALAYVALAQFRSGSIVIAVTLSVAGAIITLGGVLAWSKYSRLERFETLENQIYGPK